MTRFFTTLLLVSGLFATGQTMADELPPGGGAPGAALMRFFEALQAQDIDRIAAAHPELGAELKAEPHRAFFFITALTPTNPTIVGGSMSGHNAKVLYSSEHGNDYVSMNRAQMERVGGQWLIKNILLNCGKGC